MNTVLGLLAKGDMNCAGGDVDPNGDLFGEKKTKPAPVADRQPRQASDVGPGVIRTEAEKREAEEEARRRREEEEQAARKAAEEEERRREAEKRQNSPLNKFIRGIKKVRKNHHRRGRVKGEG